MKLLVAVSLVATISGCALAQQLPSMQYCEKVSYERDGNKINIKAQCSAPISKGFSPIEGL